MRYAQLGDILICGDLNSRVGSLRDYVTVDDKDEVPLPKNYEPDTFGTGRVTLDTLYYNCYGRWLLDLCLSSKICILNGRCNGDLVGSFISHQKEGNSVVDYNIISKRIYQRVRMFKVCFMTDYSDHCCLSLRITMNIPIEKVEMPSIMFKLPAPFIWDENANDWFQIALSTNQATQAISEYMSTDFEDNSVRIDI